MRLLSFAEFERLDPLAGHVELLRGELIHVPPAERVHNEIRENLYCRLRPAVEHLCATRLATRLGGVHLAMGYLVRTEPRSWLQPDVSIAHSDQPGDGYYEGAPLLLFEVVSEFDRAQHLEAKVAEYLGNGAEEVWVLYPDWPCAWVYHSSETKRRETSSIRSRLLPGIEIPFEEIF